MEKHFESFLQDCMDLGHTQVKLVPRIDEHGKVTFYAVGQCGPASGETFNAVVEGKHVRRAMDVPVDAEVEAIAVEDLSDEEIKAIESAPEPAPEPFDEVAHFAAFGPDGDE